MITLKDETLFLALGVIIAWGGIVAYQVIARVFTKAENWGIWLVLVIGNVFATTMAIFGVLIISTAISFIIKECSREKQRQLRRQGEERTRREEHVVLLIVETKR